MAKVGAQRSAELTGRSKSTIQRAMNGGKLSFELDNNGRRVVDVSELERVFGLKKKDKSENSGAVEQELTKAKTLLETERLKMRITMLEEQLLTAEKQIDDLQSQRDSWQKQASQVLLTSQYSQKQAEELKAELDERKRRVEERRRAQQAAQQNSSIRAHNENKPFSQDASDAGSKFWKRLTGTAA